MTPLHSYLLARPLKTERHIGDILLPDIAVEESQDALRDVFPTPPAYDPAYAHRLNAIRL